jgi:(1->4)-alpha-D-glucan 1-alpha-D-glucosylmutase
LLKAMREAKVHTAWIHNNRPYEEAVLQFAEKCLAGPKSRNFLESFVPFQRKVAFWGMLNSLSQVVLKNASPGVPDIYQGGELWDLNMADPDNRRPVDFAKRENLLTEIEPLFSELLPPDSCAGQLKNLLEEWPDGRVKLFATAAMLRARRHHPELFLQGDYRPLAPDEKADEHIAAFCRRWNDQRLLVAVPRRIYSMTRPAEEVFPFGENVWGAARLIVPEEWADATLKDIFTGRAVTVSGGGPSIPLAELFRDFPAAVLTAEK